MKKNNPMKNPEISKKASDTFNKNIKSGKIKPKVGQDNKNWKGNRSFSLTCRTRLYKTWIYPILERDGFCCSKCKSNRNLQVHHLRSLRHIIKKVLKHFNISQVDSLSNDPVYEKLIQAVINEHSLDDGITLCKFCHTDVDERYRRYNNDEKYKNCKKRKA